MKEKCSCDCGGTKGNGLVVSCSGASNLGQIANALAVAMQEEGLGQMSCLAALAAEIPAYIQAAQNADDLLVIDGCSIACGYKIADAMGIKGFRYFDVSKHTDLVKEKCYEQVDEYSKNLLDKLFEI